MIWSIISLTLIDSHCPQTVHNSGQSLLCVRSLQTQGGAIDLNLAKSSHALQKIGSQSASFLEAAEKKDQVRGCASGLLAGALHVRFGHAMLRDCTRSLWACVSIVCPGEKNDVIGFDDYSLGFFTLAFTLSICLVSWRLLIHPENVGTDFGLPSTTQGQGFWTMLNEHAHVWSWCAAAVWMFGWSSVPQS